jgi:hypothetical protein
MGANAQTSVPAFTAGQVLTAAQVTGINTGIPVFASSTERDAAFGGTGEKTLAEGQMAYLEDTNATQYYDGSSWAAIAGGKILQVVRATDSTTRSTTSATFVDANISVTITPTAATSDILLMWTAVAQNFGGTPATVVLQIADSTNTAISGAEALKWEISGGGTSYWSFNAIAYDSPATTSATTYKGRFRRVYGGTVALMNADNIGQLFAIEVGA